MVNMLFEVHISVQCLLISRDLRERQELIGLLVLALIYLNTFCELCGTKIIGNAPKLLPVDCLK